MALSRRLERTGGESGAWRRGQRRGRHRASCCYQGDGGHRRRERQGSPPRFLLLSGARVGAERAGWKDVGYVLALIAVIGADVLAGRDCVDSGRARRAKSTQSWWTRLFLAVIRIGAEDGVSLPGNVAHGGVTPSASCCYLDRGGGWRVIAGQRRARWGHTQRFLLLSGVLGAGGWVAARLATPTGHGTPGGRRRISRIRVGRARVSQPVPGGTARVSQPNPVGGRRRISRFRVGRLGAGQPVPGGASTGESAGSGLGGHG